MNNKKNLVLVMNCAADGLYQIFMTSNTIKEMYKIKIITTYVVKDNSDAQRNSEAAIRSADVVVSQNVISVSWLTNEYIGSIIHKKCIFIRLAFWRFNGYWPIDTPRFHEAFWYLPKEFGRVDAFDDYKNSPINRIDISMRFEAEVEKFRLIESDSDLKMTNFLLSNHQKIKLFSDSWHPTAYFYFQVAIYIMSQIGHEPDIILPYSLKINRDRIRLISQSVTEELKLQFDQSIIRFNEELITEKAFFEFSKFVEFELEEISTIRQVPSIFEKWRTNLGLEKKLFDFGATGEAEQSSRSQWSHPDDPQRALRSTLDAPFAFHTGLEANPWWTVDLKEFREVSRIVVSNRADMLPERAVPLRISYSLNSMVWHHVSTINYNFGSEINNDFPLTIDMINPLLGRYWKFEVEKLSYLHLSRVKLMNYVIGTDL